MFDDDDRSALKRYRRKQDQIRDIHNEGGYREREDSLKDELRYLWDQMTEEEKDSIRKDHQRTPQEYVPTPEPAIQEIPVRNKSRRAPLPSILWPTPTKREPVKPN